MTKITAHETPNMHEIQAKMSHTDSEGVGSVVIAAIYWLSPLTKHLAFDSRPNHFGVKMQDMPS